MKRFIDIALWTLVLLCAAHQLAAEDTRDPWLWPFSSESIWNTPIGSDAVYESEGHFATPASVRADEEWHIKVPKGSPERKLFRPGPWTNRAAGTKFLRKLRLPDDLIIDSARPGYSPNDCSALLMPDGRTIEQLGPLARFEVGGPAWGIPNPFFGGSDIQGPGVKGGHWGSGLSSIGGSLRQGQLTGKRPIRHVLKVNVFCQRYLSFDANNKTPGYRWPAITADKYADHPLHGYGGKNPRAEMGALLAIHPRHTAASLGLKTRSAMILFEALQNYGAYIVDDCSNDAFVFCASHEALGEFREHYDFDFDQSSKSMGPAAEWYQDITRLVSVLSIIDNNRPDAVGGGGKHRRALPPPFGPMDSQPPTVPTEITASDLQPTRLQLAWKRSTDNHMLGGYEVWHKDKRVAETFGKTSTNIASLPAGQRISLKVRAKDMSGNTSGFSTPLPIELPPLAAGTIIADFDNGEAIGWKLDKGAAVFGDHLEIASWKGSSRAICTGTPLTEAGFTFSAHLRGVGTASGNVTVIDFRRSLDGKSGGTIEFGGGKSPVKLVQRTGGKQKTLATAKDYVGNRFELTCSRDGQVTLVTWQGKERIVVFHQINMQLPPRGHMGFGARYNTIHIDRVRVTPEITEDTH